MVEHPNVQLGDSLRSNEDHNENMFDFVKSVIFFENFGHP